MCLLECIIRKKDNILFIYLILNFHSYVEAVTSLFETYRDLQVYSLFIPVTVCVGDLMEDEIFSEKFGFILSSKHFLSEKHHVMNLMMHCSIEI